ncbi:hypothetical protein [Microbacterium imperiale]|uniref:hypothetical protein n=1 Tax=Microbacterium imperiale TaxID=33884 RepID=UPI001AE93B83|nr:hypothetical protein [Microbacterium imperiale]MBP2422060.1 hypothetical protein [Microbacterium imperiale]MDS0200218.1 hypothetical protein [Microbacterium imperiale]BFE39368.1 hypothetical protein GCM10017544_03240 [Microbacterium imperiale]
MPGRTPAEAHRAFVEPLEAAVACLGLAKITFSNGGAYNVHKDHAWNLGRLGAGMVFPGGYCFRAAMKYRFVPHETGWRVTTLEYIYSLSVADEVLWAMHWHPVGDSHETRPHLHMAIPGAGGARAHRPVPRMTFEEAVEWVIESGIDPARDDWMDVLTKSKQLHVLHRTWHGDSGQPDES